MAARHGPDTARAAPGVLTAHPSLPHCLYPSLPWVERGRALSKLTLLPSVKRAQSKGASIQPVARVFANGRNTRAAPCTQRLRLHTARAPGLSLLQPASLHALTAGEACPALAFSFSMPASHLENQSPFSLSFGKDRFISCNVGTKAKTASSNLASHPAVSTSASNREACSQPQRSAHVCQLI